jgi:hypothetical protein
MSASIHSRHERLAAQIAILAFAIPDWGGRLIRLEQVGGRTDNRNVFALFGAVAVLLTATVTVSRATLSEGGGNLKCYDLKGAIAKCSPVDRPPLVVRTNARMRD